MKTIELTNYEVKIKEDLTWGESKEIQSALLKDVKVGTSGVSEIDAGQMIQATYKALELVIEEIKDNDGAEVKFSKKWMNNLPIEDGNKLEDQANEFISGQKKKD